MKETKKTSTADIVILACLILISVYMFAASASFARETRLFPQIVSAVVIVCCAAKLILTIRAQSKAAAGADAAKAPAKKLFTRDQLMVLAVSILYVALLNPLGFLVSTVLVLIALPCLMGYRRWKVLIPFAVLITIAFYVIFRYGFYIKLPAGILSGLL